MMPRRLAIAWFLALIPTTMPASSAEKRPGPPAPVPRPELTPGQVIEIQLEALQFNDRPAKDAGIATTFQFASPGNRETTGPLERFALIVKGPAFQPLINHRIAGFGPLLVKGRLALCRVTVVAADGQAIEYEFRLSKDVKSGCWFTDGVIPMPAKAPIDPGKIARRSQTTPLVSVECLLHFLSSRLCPGHV